jgi:hypothetical protein
VKPFVNPIITKVSKFLSYFRTHSLQFQNSYTNLLSELLMIDSLLLQIELTNLQELVSQTLQLLIKLGKREIDKILYITLFLLN